MSGRKDCLHSGVEVQLLGRIERLLGLPDGTVEHLRLDIPQHTGQGIIRAAAVAIEERGSRWRKPASTRFADLRPVGVERQITFQRGLCRGQLGQIGLLQQQAICGLGELVDQTEVRADGAEGGRGEHGIPEQDDEQPRGWLRWDDVILDHHIP